MELIKTKWLAIAAVAIAFGACNKDEEITTDIPSDFPDSAYGFIVEEYLPAPGQFINEEASGFEGVATMEDACAYAQSRLEAGNFVSLGAWGGTLTVRCTRPIPNTGGYDFSIAGNAFNTSNEPGIVWVMQDSNGNGKADDVWYELKGSYYGKEGFEKNYWVTYYRPSADNSDVEWRDSNGETGVIKWLGTFHGQSSYYPSWVEAESYTLRGSRLPARIVQNPATGVWENRPYEWGYADNNGEDSVILNEEGRTVQKNFFRISDAVDENGASISLESIDFIKVQTAINGSTSVTGENSTEVCGFFR